MGSCLKAGFGWRSDVFFAGMVLRFLIAFVLFGLAVERLTLAATFFFILLCPCSPHRNRGRSRLWKSQDQLSRDEQGCVGGAALYTQKLTMRQLHQSKCKTTLPAEGSASRSAGTRRAKCRRGSSWPTIPVSTSGGRTTLPPCRCRSWRRACFRSSYEGCCGRRVCRS